MDRAPPVSLVNLVEELADSQKARDPDPGDMGRLRGFIPTQEFGARATGSPTAPHANTATIY